ncbi:MAG: repeat-containing protein [Verrucomicrobiales bacterium]|nr:repeat-containing protein [Verrucomicrobiales bacterium]
MNHSFVSNGQSNEPTNSDKRWRFIICAVLIAVTLGIYFQVSHFEFINFDDPSYVYENDVIQQGLTWPGIIWAFAREHYANWHPLTWMSHMLDCQLFGLDAGGHHIINVLLHTATGTLLFLLLNRITGAMWRSAFVAAVFLWHPMHVESVAWIAERKDVLSALFFVLTLMCYTRYAEIKQPDSLAHPPTHSRKYYILAVVLYALGLLSKPMLVTLPFVLLLLDAWPLRRFNPNKQTLLALVREKIPFFVLAGALSVATFVAQKTGGSVAPIDRLPLQDRLGNALISYVRYIEKLFWPADLTFFYMFPKPIPWGEVITAVALLLIVTALLLAVWQKFPWAIIGWFWFIGMLVPVIGIVQVGRQGMADRYSYLPSIGLFIAITWTVCELSQKLGNKKTMTSALAIAALLISATLAVAAHRQIRHWQNSATLAQHALDIDPNNAYVHQNLAMYWFRHDRPDLAIQLLREADRLHPGDPGGLNALGWVLMTEGHKAEAEEKFREVLKVKPDDAQALCTLGTIAVTGGKLNEGLNLIREAVAARPANAEYRYELAHALVVSDNLAEALEQYRTVLHYDPHFLPALREMAWLLATCPHSEIRNGAEAVTFAERACQITHNSDPQCLNVLDVAYAEASRFNEAISVASQERELYLQMGNTNAATMADNRITLYKQSKPFHTGSR